MPTDVHQEEQTTPPAEPTVDDGYWSALLAEGEFSRSVQPDPGQTPVPYLTQTSQFEPSAAHVNGQSDWDEIERIMRADETLELPVIGHNRGGLLVEWRSLRGFLPASQLVSFPVVDDETARRQVLVDHVGKRLKLRVIEWEPDKNRLIFSERAAQVAAGTRDNLLATLTPGTLVRGSVTNLCHFGAFVDLGGVEGLIHISELSWGRVSHPRDVLERGQEVDVCVLDVDADQGRVALSMKRLQPDPWETVEQRYNIGEVVEGQITNVVDFGAFACIEEGLEGLIHFSELAEGHFLHPRNVVQEGEIVRARILTIDGKGRRLGLSLRGL